MAEPSPSPLENEFLILREVAAGPIVFTARLDRHPLANGWVELPIVGIWAVHAGKITVWRDYFDAETILSEWPSAAA